MTVVSFRKRRVVHRRRSFVPRRRVFKSKSLYPKRTIYIHKGRFRLFKHRKARVRFFRRFNLYVIPTGKKRAFSQSYAEIKSKSIKAKEPKKRNIYKKKSDWKAKRKPDAWRGQGFAGKKKKEFRRFEDKNFDIFVNKFVDSNYGRKGFKRGGDTSWARSYKSYGPMKPLGPKLIFEIIPTGIYKAFVLARVKAGTHQKVLKETREAMEKVLSELISYATDIIGTYVPKDTGTLQASMIRSIKRSKVKGTSLKVSLDTGLVAHANVVNNMPQSMVRHPHVGGRPHLHDPEAVNDWFQYIDKLLIKKSVTLIKDFLNSVQTIWRETYYNKNIPSPMSGVRAMKRSVTRTRTTTIPETVQLYGKGRLEWQKTHDPYQQEYQQPLGSGQQLVKVFDKQNYPKRTVKRIVGKGTSIEDLELEKHLKMNKIRQNVETRRRHANVVYYPIEVIKDMFKIKGLS